MLRHRSLLHPLQNIISSCTKDLTHVNRQTDRQTDRQTSNSLDHPPPPQKKKNNNSNNNIHDEVQLHDLVARVLFGKLPPALVGTSNSSQNPSSHDYPTMDSSFPQPYTVITLWSTNRMSTLLARMKVCSA